VLGGYYLVLEHPVAVRETKSFGSCSCNKDKMASKVLLERSS